MREIGSGIFGYFAFLPLYALGIILLMVIVLALDLHPNASGADTIGQSDPITNALAGSHPLVLFVFLVGIAVVAPFFEEVLFRGALYGAMRKRMHVIPAMLLISIIFAALHPYALIQLPAVMMIGLWLSILREWRGSLIAPMTAHAIHNGAIGVVVFGM